MERALELHLGRHSRGCLRRGWTAWSWIWEVILKAACEEDGQPGTGSRAEFGQEFSRLPAERMDRLELVLELELGRNSRGCLRRGLTSWNWLWSWNWEGILEAACRMDGQAGIGWTWVWEGILEAACQDDREAATGLITSHPTRNGEVRGRYQIWAGRGRSSTGSVKIASEPEEPA